MGYKTKKTDYTPIPKAESDDFIALAERYQALATERKELDRKMIGIRGSLLRALLGPGAPTDQVEEATQAIRAAEAETVAKHTGYADVTPSLTGKRGPGRPRKAKLGTRADSKAHEERRAKETATRRTTRKARFDKDLDEDILQQRKAHERAFAKRDQDARQQRKAHERAFAKRDQGARQRAAERMLSAMEPGVEYRARDLQTLAGEDIKPATFARALSDIAQSDTVERTGMRRATRYRLLGKKAKAPKAPKAKPVTRSAPAKSSSTPVWNPNRRSGDR